jgi:hypothetical protein
MTMYVPSFRSISKISKWVVNWCVAAIIIALIYSIFQSYEIIQYLSDNLVSLSILAVDSIIGTIYGIVGIILLILTLYWFYRATKNAHQFGAKEITSPVMAVIWWFIPILEIWKPYQVAQQIWRASNPQIIFSNGTEWKNLPSSKNIKLWWFLGLLSIFVVFVGLIIGIQDVGLQYYLDPQQMEQVSPVSNKITFYTNVAGILSNMILIISRIFFIRMIKDIFLWQEIKSGRSI